MNKLTFLRTQFLALVDAGDLSAARDVGLVLLQEHEHIGTHGSLGYADDLFNLAQLHEGMGDPGRAAELYSESTSHVCRIEGEGMAFAARLIGLALVLHSMGGGLAGLLLLGQASIIVKREAGDISREYADVLYNLGNVCADMGRNDEALAYHVRALMVRRMFSAETFDMVDSYHSVSLAHQALGQNSRATSYAELALSRLDEKSEEYPAAAFYLAGLHEEEGHFDSALKLYDSVLLIIEEGIGRSNSVFVQAAFARARLLARMQRLGEALAAHEEILVIFEFIVGNRHAFYADCLASMAHVNSDLGDTKTAEQLLLNSIKIRRSISGDPITDIVSLIQLRIGEKRPEDALSALIYALMCAKKTGGIASVINKLSFVFAGAGDEYNNQFLTAIERLNDRNKLRPIIEEWAEWEEEEYL